MRLGIAVVYLVTPGTEWMLELHLRKIAECTTVPYTIYAFAQRSSPAAQEILRKRDDVVLPQVPETDLRMKFEHAYYLEKMIEQASADGCTHFATFDHDSFPVEVGWVERLDAKLSDQTPFAGVLREENLDTDLAHPSGLLCRMAFYDTFDPAFLPSQGDPLVIAHNAATGQRWDTGIGYTATAHDAGLTWVPLRRSNSRNEHSLMAGIYDNAVFHLGAMGRGPIFRTDWNATPWRRTVFSNGNRPVIGPMLKKGMTRLIIHKNTRLQANIFEALKTRPDAYINELRGKVA